MLVVPLWYNYKILSIRQLWEVQAEDGANGVKWSIRGVIWGAGSRPPRKKKKGKKEKRKQKKKKKEKKKERNYEWRQITTYKVLFFFQFFNSPLALKNKKNFGPPRKS